jgi:hypothetical protein
VDEVVIRDMTTEQVCDELLVRGYNFTNIRYIGLDPRDANKRRSTSETTDAEIIYRKLKVRPKHRIIKNTGHLHVRLDVIANMLAGGKIVFAEHLKPKGTSSPGVINGLRNFATRKMKDDPENFIDEPTTETKEKWKHYVDAMHYIFMEYEKGEYQRVVPQAKRGRAG